MTPRPSFDFVAVGLLGSLAIAAAGTVALTTTGCASGVKLYECETGVVNPDVDPDAVWRCHRDIMRRAARGGRFTLREFREAAEFFERLTSIPAVVRPTDLGPLPGRGLRGRLREWDAWYAENRDRLYWDGARRRVAVATPAAQPR